MSLPARIADLVAAIAAAPWFAECGAPLGHAARADARTLAASFGFADASIAGVADGREAARVAQRPDWSRAWWARESEEEAALKSAAARQFGDDALLAELSRVAQAAEPLFGAATLSLARTGLADPVLARAASGAAAMACHQAALARAASALAEHAFAVKFRLFAAGRWPLGIVGGSFFVF